MKLKYCLTSLALLAFLFAQAQRGPVDVHFEFQAYPTGLIPGLRFDLNFAEKNAAHLRLGYQLIGHRDLGKHMDETGNGFGFTLGYKRYFKSGFQGFFIGARNDIWFNEINWEDFGIVGARKGTTNITVVQPTAEAGYLFEMGKGWIFAPSLAFGFEINVKTDGEPTGEGAIILVGLNIGKRF